MKEFFEVCIQPSKILQDRKSESKTRPKEDVKRDLSKKNEKVELDENVLIKQKKDQKIIDKVLFI
jgi:hypothetical protein